MKWDVYCFEDRKVHEVEADTAGDAIAAFEQGSTIEPYRRRTFAIPAGSNYFPNPEAHPAWEKAGKR